MSSLNSKVVQKAVQKRSRNDENHDQEELKQLYDRHGMIKCPIWHRDMPRNNVALGTLVHRMLPLQRFGTISRASKSSDFEPFENLHPYVI
jgi:hypothetical protein